MDDIQKLEFEILEYFAKFAKENDINYSLYAGTLLGSIRHKGFIPWDDDIDVSMNRENYEKFIQKFSHSNYKNDGFTFQTKTKQNFIAMPISKIRSDKMNIREKLPKTQEGNYGPWIDIFPFDNVPDDENLRRKQYNSIRFYNNIIKRTLLIQVEPEDKGLKKLVKRVIQKTNEMCYKWYFFLPYVFKKRDETIQMYNNVETMCSGDISYMFYKSYDAYMTSIFENEDLKKQSIGIFEGKEFPIPQAYDKILSRQYGDYMTLPSEKDRKVHKLEYEIGK